MIPTIPTGDLGPGSRTAGASPLAAAGHLGLWAGMYVAAAFVFTAQAARPGVIWPRWDLSLSVLLIATGCYALDRVKLRTAWIDPADEASQPSRYGYLRPRAGVVRALAAAMLLAGGALGARATPWAWAATAAAPLGVALYAPRGREGRRPRLKDRVWLKNSYVGVGVAGFAGLAALADGAAGQGGTLGSIVDGARRHAGALACALVLVCIRGALDAALCDIDDEETDRRFGTSTPATWLGGRRLWGWAVFARAGLTVAVLGAWPCPLPARIAWGAAMTVGTVALRARPPQRVRDWVDARFLAEAAVATIVLMAMKAGG